MINQKHLEQISPDVANKKSQLQANRRHAQNAWLAGQGLVGSERTLWKQSDRDRDAAKFSDHDQAYEAAKTKHAVS
jgi:hypothetical protein